jgi:hypothetical protein
MLVGDHQPIPANNSDKRMAGSDPILYNAREIGPWTDAGNIHEDTIREA